MIKRKSSISCVLILLVSSSMILIAAADSRKGNVNNDNNSINYNKQRASRLQTNTRRKKKHIRDSQKRKLNWGSVTWMDGGNSPTKDNNDSIKATKSSKRKVRTKGKARKHIDDNWGHGGVSNNTTLSSVLPQRLNCYRLLYSS